MAFFNVKNFNLITASMVNWMANAQTKITDFNRGSVIRTMLETVALEIEEVYFRIYQSLGASIAESVYTAFSFPKLPPVRATGQMRFYRLNPATFDITVPAGSVVQNSEGLTYEVTSEGAIIYGPKEFDIVEFADVAGEYQIKFIPGTGDVRIQFQDGESVEVTSSTSNDGTYTIVERRYTGGQTILVVTESVTDETVNAILKTIGKTQVVVDARASGEGSNYNVNALTVTKLVSPILGIDKVENITPFAGGAGVESDISRKARFSFYVRSLAQGTLSALEFAAINVPGVISARAVDNQPLFFLQYERVSGGPPPPNQPATANDYSDRANTPYEQIFPLMDGGFSGGESAALFAAGIQFDTLYVDVVTPAKPTYDPGDGSQVGYGTWQYYSSSAGAFIDIPGDANLVDETKGFTRSGSVTFDLNAGLLPMGDDWGNIVFDDVGEVGQARGNVLFPIRFLESDTDHLTQAPEAIQAFIKPEPGWVHVFVSQANAVLDTDVKENVEYMLLEARAAGIFARVIPPVKRKIQVKLGVRVSPGYNSASVLDVVRLSMTVFATNFGLGSSVVESEIVQYVRNLNTKAIADVVVLELENFVAPNIGNVVASPNQLLLIEADDVTVEEI